MPLIDSSIRFGDYEVDPSTAELRKNGTKVKLQEQPFQILIALLEQPGKVVSRETLRRKLWPTDVYVDYERSLNTAMKKLREALEDEAERPRYIETLPRHGYRLIAHVGRRSGEGSKRWYQSWWRVGCSIAAVVMLATGIVYYLRHTRVQALTEKDAVVVAEFANKTNDPVFTDTLRQGLLVQLSQSPFLNILPDTEVRRTLRQMSRNANETLTDSIAREVCQRSNSKVFIQGSIASLGKVYVLGLQAVNCHSGDVLVQEQVQVQRKEDVLNALGKEGTHLRRKLGEALASVKKFDVPLEQATTSSLEALQAYSLGIKTARQKGVAPSLPLLQRATELDPNFAMAFTTLGVSYRTLWQEEQAIQNFTKAYSLRDKATEFERLRIEALYYHHVTRQLDKAIQAYGLVKSIYPRYQGPYANLGTIFSSLGQYDRAIEETREYVRLYPSVSSYGNLASMLLHRELIDEAKAVVAEAKSKGFTGGWTLYRAYWIAFLTKDSAAMDRIMREAMTSPESADQFLELQSITEAYFGRLKKSEELMNRAADSARRNGLEQTANLDVAEKIWIRAQFGFSITPPVKNTMSTATWTLYLTALSLAVSGHLEPARAIVDELSKKFPDDTVLNLSALPTIEAAIHLRRNDPARAVQVLQKASSIELGYSPVEMYCVYFRGDALLRLGRGTDAAAEFQKILDHPGVVINSPVTPLAHLGMARARVLEGDNTKARAKYEYFLNLWKDADPDIPVYRQAKAEYAKLKR